MRTASAPWVAFHRSAGLPPGCFAVVMATGIVSVAAHQHRQGALSTALFVVALSTYAVLAALMLARRPRRIRRRLAAPSARLEALTVVAASAVPGVRAVLGGAAWAGAALGVVAVLAWAPLSIAAVAGVLAARQTWSRQASGTWLLLVVATESLAVLAATLATVRPSPVLAVAGTCWFALGLVCYPPLTGLVVARLLSASRAAGLPATLRYGLGWWAMAFPLGMYAVATNDLGDRTGSGELWPWRAWPSGSRWRAGWRSRSACCDRVPGGGSRRGSDGPAPERRDTRRSATLERPAGLRDAMEPMRPYILDDAATSEYQRLDLMSKILDPWTRGYLAGLGVGQGWRCLELGGGNGSIAEWLCSAVGPSGSVTAVDINTVLLELIPAQNLTVRQLDVRTGELPADPYDLVTCRALLHQIAEHAPAVLARMAAAVKPGGWLLVQEPDFHLAPTTEPAAWAATWKALIEWGHDNGVDWRIGRALPSMVSKLGLGRPQAETDVQNIRGRDRGALYFKLFFAEVRDRVLESGRLDAATLDAASGLLDDPDYWTQCWMMTAVWGRKPVA